MDDAIAKRIMRVLHNAYDEVPYFNILINDIISDESDADTDTDFLTPELFRKIPTFDKNKIIEIGWPNFVSGRYLDETYRPVLQSARMERTSGTSGPAMSILWNNRDYWTSTRNHWAYRHLFFGITPNSRMCTISRRVLDEEVCICQPEENKIMINTRALNQETVAQIIERLQDFQPEWLYMQNSIIYTLVRFAKQLGLEFPKSIRYIEYVGEPICRYYREEIEKFIDVPSSNMYGCVETNGIAYECSEGHMHLLSENVHTEIVDSGGNCLQDGEVGFVCVTGLYNTAMPMLRYRLNDRAHIVSDLQCPCGNHNPIIKLHAARLLEYMILDNPAVFSPAMLYYPINGRIDITSVESSDLLFNLRMNELDHYELLIYQNPNKEIQAERILHDLFEAYGIPNVHFSVRRVDAQIPSLPAGILRIR